MTRGIQLGKRPEGKSLCPSLKAQNESWNKAGIKMFSVAMETGCSINTGCGKVYPDEGIKNKN